MSGRTITIDRNEYLGKWIVRVRDPKGKLIDRQRCTTLKHAREVADAWEAHYNAGGTP